MFSKGSLFHLPLLGKMNSDTSTGARSKPNPGPYLHFQDETILNIEANFFVS